MDFKDDARIDSDVIGSAGGGGGRGGRVALGGGAGIALLDTVAVSFGAHGFVASMLTAAGITALVTIATAATLVRRRGPRGT